MKIALLGDVALFGKYSTKNQQNIYNYFKKVRETLTQYDLIIANLETPFSFGDFPYRYKSANIFSYPENVEILNYLGVNIVSLANNHIYDFGKKSFELTKKILNNNNIQYFGVEGKQIFISDKNCRLAFSGFCCYSTNPIGMGSFGVNELRYPEIEKTLIKNHDSGFNNIISVHSGKENIHYPSYEHIKLARKLSTKAPFVYYGHHPHVLQGIEKSNDSLIAYSLGNFCFDNIYTKKSSVPLVNQSTSNKTSIILELEYQNNKLFSHKLIPIYANEDIMEIGNKEILSRISEYSQNLTLDENTYKKMRSIQLNKLNSKIKSKRDFQWVFKRLNFRTLILLKEIIINKIKFRKYISNHIKRS
jgi:gamma-polyglutamate biosynthesis protein CapA